jgi:hypothetical protein
MTTQSIKEDDYGDTIIVNELAIGRDIQAFCEKDENISLFPSHGFFDGGCLALAIGIRDWLKADKIESSNTDVDLAVLTYDGIIEHFAVVITPSFDNYSPIYIDGDGIATKDEFIKKSQQTLLPIYKRDSALLSLERLSDWEGQFGQFNQDKTGIIDYKETGVPAELTKRLSRQVMPGYQALSAIEDAIAMSDELEPSLGLSAS